MARGEQARLMEAHVIRARRSLEGGSPMTEVLAELWQLAFAAGAGAREQSAARSRGRLPATSAVAMAEGWRWGSAAMHGISAAGTAFTYGGCDPVKPTASRPARSSGMRKNREYMTLEDTGEQVPVTVMFWCKRDDAPAVPGD